jgi:periplasmic protein TonB
MKTKKKIPTLTNLKAMSVLPAILLGIFLLAACAAGRKSVKIPKENVPASVQEEPFVVVEVMPMFPGGDSTLIDYINKNTKYPESAKLNKIQGKVIVRFCVTATGSVDRISVLRGVNPELDTEAVRVISSLPTFSPGRQGGKPVPVWYMAPIDFKLK